MPSDNPFEQPGLLAILLAAFTGFIGWRVGTAKDSVRIEAHEARLNKLSDQIEAMSRSESKESKETGEQLARIAVTLNSVAETLGRLDRRLSKLEDNS